MGKGRICRWSRRARGSGRGRRWRERACPVAGGLHGKREAASLPLTLAHFSAAVIPAARVLAPLPNEWRFGPGLRKWEFVTSQRRCLVSITNEAMSSPSVVVVLLARARVALEVWMQSAGLGLPLGGRSAQDRTLEEDSPWGPGRSLAVCPWGALREVGTGRPGTHCRQ